MKKIISLFLSVLVALTCVSCKPSVEQTPLNMEPQVSQMKAICELAVMECYYHNVAKYTEENAEGALWWKKDKHFWVEYSGIVKVGVDMSLVSIDVADTKVTISLPSAKLLTCTVDSASLSEDSFIVDKDSAKIEAADQIKAFADAQTDLENTAATDTTLLASAQQRVQSLLEEYINNIGNVTGKKYSIQWIYLDATGSPQ